MDKRQTREYWESAITEMMICDWKFYAPISDIVDVGAIWFTYVGMSDIMKKTGFGSYRFHKAYIDFAYVLNYVGREENRCRFQ